MSTMKSPERPALLTFGMYTSGICGACFLLALPFAAAGVGQYSINEEQVSPHDFFMQAGLLIALIGGLLVAIAFAIATRKEWSRNLIVIFWLAGALSAATPTFMEIGDTSRAAALVAALFAASPSLVALAIAWWYLYRKPNVVGYYSSLEAQELKTITPSSS
jgi:hypothetical protein